MAKKIARSGDRVLNGKEAADLYQMEIDKSLAEAAKARAYAAFFEYCQQRVISAGVATVGDLPLEEQEIIAQKHTALVEKYGPTELGPFTETGEAWEP